MQSYQIQKLIKLKSVIKYKTEVALRLTSNMIGNSDDKISFAHELILNNKQVANICQVLANNSSTDIKLLKIQLSKMIQSGSFFGRLHSSLIKTGLPLMKNVIKPLAKIVSIPLGLTVSASAEDTRIHRKS